MTEHIAGRRVNRNTYINHGCRCDGCREANRHYMAERRSGSEVAPSVRRQMQIDSRLSTLLQRWARQHISADDLAALRSEARQYVLDGRVGWRK